MDFSKGQVILEWLFGVLNFPNKSMQKFGGFALESKNCLNQKNKGPFMY